MVAAETITESETSADAESEITADPETPAVTETSAAPEASALPETVAAETTAGPETPAAPETSSALPLANYDELSVASLRARLRNLSVGQLTQLIEYEKGHAGRADVITMFERRIAKVESEV